MADISISTELNPSPLVKIFATKFRKAIHQPGYCQQLAKARGTFALKSSKDPQAITITISRMAWRKSSGMPWRLANC